MPMLSKRHQTTAGCALPRSDRILGKLVHKRVVIGFRYGKIGRILSIQLQHNPALLLFEDLYLLHVENIGAVTTHRGCIFVRFSSIHFKELRSRKRDCLDLFR